MNEQHSAKEIGEHGFTHWTGRPITPGEHTIAFIPQTIVDSWEAYCSCGQWRGITSSYDTPTREETFAVLRAAFDKHVSRK
jgi:hypothetical protein